MKTVTWWLVLAFLLLLVTWRITSRNERRPKKTEPSAPDGHEP